MTRNSVARNLELYGESGRSHLLIDYLIGDDQNDVFVGIWAVCIVAV